MAHGYESDEIRFSDGKGLKLRQLIEPLLECQSLHNKPKIVINVGCRGISHLESQITDIDHVDEIAVVAEDSDTPARIKDHVRIAYKKIIFIVCFSFSLRANLFSSSQLFYY